jgi:hypothetical protein
VPRQINSTGNANIGVSASQIVPANASRAGIVITNLDSTNSVFIGNADVTLVGGFTLKAGTSVTIPVQNAIWGIAAGSIPITWMEIQ